MSIYLFSIVIYLPCLETFSIFNFFLSVIITPRFFLAPARFHIAPFTAFIFAFI